MLDHPHEVDEVDRNFDAFVERLPEILPNHRGQFALMRDRDIVTYCGTALAAMLEGAKRFTDGRYSIQEVTSERDNLGFYSYAGGSGKA